MEFDHRYIMSTFSSVQAISLTIPLYWLDRTDDFVRYPVMCGYSGPHEAPRSPLRRSRGTCVEHVCRVSLTRKTCHEDVGPV